MIKNGILLAGGTGSRIFPLNSLFNKHLIPVHNKFIIDYPLETLKNLGVTNLTIVLGGNHFEQVVSHVKDGSHLGMSVNYVYQDKPLGISQAINICQKFVMDGDQFVVQLGDNIFESPIQLSNINFGAQVILHKHPNLSRFGVASLKNNKIIKIEEKPSNIDPKFDNYAITGCYIFDRDFFRYFKQTKLSLRGEFEITDIIDLYNKDNNLGHSFAENLWSDAGSHESINYLNNYFFKK